MAKRAKRSTAKTLIGVATFAFLLALPLADEIAGRIYFTHLCNTKAGVKIFQTVSLPAKYWDAEGKPIFYNEANGNFYLKEYRVDYKTGAYSPRFHIDHAGYAWVDRQTGKTLGEETDYMYWGGWVRRNLTPHNSATACEGRRERSRSLIKQVFVRNEHVN